MSKWAKNKNGILIPNREAGFIQPGIGLMNKKQGGSGSGDPYWANVVSLLNMEGSNNSTIFTDSASARTWTPVGNVHIDNSLGYNAAAFDGVSDYITTSYTSIDFDWWKTDYTIEALVVPANLSNWSYYDGSQRPNMINNGNVSNTTNYWSFGPINSGKIAFYYYNGVANSVVSTAIIASNNLAHIAVSHAAGNIILAVNGILDSSTVVSGTPQSSEAVTMNLGELNGISINGHIQAIRLTKGVARYTANFTPPTAPFPNHS